MFLSVPSYNIMCGVLLKLTSLAITTVSGSVTKVTTIFFCRNCLVNVIVNSTIISLFQSQFCLINCYGKRRKLNFQRWVGKFSFGCWTRKLLLHTKLIFENSTDANEALQPQNIDPFSRSNHKKNPCQLGNQVLQSALLHT